MNPFPLPRYIQLYPTHRCNQACSFCFNQSTTSVADMSYDNACRLLKIMIELGIRELDIMGGEPFLLKWMPDFIQLAAGKNFILNISTNGSSPEILKKLAGIDPEKLNIGVSLEGSSAERHNCLTRSDNFEKAVRSINALVSMGLNPIVKTVVNRSTREDIPAIVRLLQGCGVKRYYLIHMDLFSRGRSTDQTSLGFMEFLGFYRKMTSQHVGIAIHKVNASCFEKQLLPHGVRCAGGVRKLSVMPDGSVYPCNLFHHFPEFIVGNIFTNSFEDIWSSPTLDFFRSFDGNACGFMNCSNHASCTGGCPAHGYLHTGEMNASDVRCAAELTHMSDA